MDLSCSSVRFCMAVTDLDAEATGYSVAAEQDDRAYVWHGRNWSRVAWPDQHVAPSALACASQGSCLAVAVQAGPHVPPAASDRWLRWDGRRWALQARPMPGAIVVTSVSCATSGRCMAVGASRTDDVALDVAGSDYWDGRAWQVAGGPPTVSGSGAIEAVACLQARSCLAVVGAYWTHWRT
ncbi:MAG: hypothetical protein M0T80_03525 [Actinomycetota bacterium]|nr:hypothetical protein [Actinomycetota bacterium]